MACQVPTRANVEGKQWRAHHQKVREKEALPAASWTAKHSLTGVPSSARARDIIDLTYSRFQKQTQKACEKKGKHFEEMLQTDGFLPCDLLLDISQDGLRKAYSNAARSMCSNTSFYSFQADRMISPREHLHFLGWPQSSLKLEGIGLAALRDLSGEAMAPPSVGGVLTALALQMDSFERL
eukprot:6480659-Amphidinium_carterae.3